MLTLLPTTSKNFDLMADSVANMLFNDGVALTEGVAKIAAQHSLNPAETQRLVEKSNTFATVRLIRASLDKKAELELADYETVLSKTHGGAAPQEKTASARTAQPRIPNKRKAAEEVSFAKLAGVAEAPAPAKYTRAKLTNVFTLRKQAAVLTNESTRLELRVLDALDSMADEFSRINGPSFAKFANEAVTVYGEPAAVVLSQVAKCIRESDTFTKVAYIVDDTSSLFTKLAEVLDDLSTLVVVHEALGAVKAQEADTWNAIKGK